MAQEKKAAQARCIIVMGVSGSGKSTVAQHLADSLDAHFIDGDDLHPADNIRKMAAGEALTDQDRVPWLARIQQHIGQSLACQQSIVVVCSALKKQYRDTFRQHTAALTFVFLDGSFDVIAQRMRARENHFMKVDMLNSQFATLERPDAFEQDVIAIDVREPVKVIVKQLESRLAFSAV
ncbi:gluconokinase [Alteromonas halophila]|uniref:Gluconokinase n=1 Tax=Alteromonas halophila TaxID=516698 RepID=A0A918JQ52_9ALTE|nr:gluconokinase [Alteromonas halophila]GGW89390.1 gluconokinase [Alteromonas halophila]